MSKKMETLIKQFEIRNTRGRPIEIGDYVQCKAELLRLNGLPDKMLKVKGKVISVKVTGTQVVAYIDWEGKCTKIPDKVNVADLKKVKK